MKKLHLLWIVLALTLALALVLSACGVNLVKPIIDSGTNDNNDDNSGTIDDKNALETVTQKVDALAAANGLYVRYKVQSDTNKEDGNVDVIMAFGRKGELYYWCIDDEESYLDLCDGKADMYSKEKEGNWEKSDLSILGSEYLNTVKMAYTPLFSLMSAYSGMIDSGMTKGTETVAGRQCDKYVTTDATIAGMGNLTICVDRETGICLRLTGKASTTTGASAWATIECVEFKTSFNPTLPTVTESNGDNENQNPETGNPDKDKPNQGSDNPNQGSDNPNQGGDNPNQGGDNPNQGSDNPNQGSIAADFATYGSIQNELLSAGLKYTAKMESGETDMAISIVAKGDVYYIESNGQGVYYDVRNEAYYDVYTINDQNWLGVRVQYTDADAMAPSKEAMVASINQRIGVSLNFTAPDTSKVYKKSTDTYLERTVAVYSDITEYNTVKTATTIKIDAATSLLMYHQTIMTVADQEYGKMTYQCTAIDTSCADIQLPDVQVIDPSQFVTIADKYGEIVNDESAFITMLRNHSTEGVKLLYTKVSNGNNFAYELQWKGDTIRYTAKADGEEMLALLSLTDNSVIVYNLVDDEYAEYTDSQGNHYYVDIYGQDDLAYALYDVLSLAQLYADYAEQMMTLTSENGTDTYCSVENDVKLVIDAETKCLLQASEDDGDITVEGNIAFGIDLQVELPTQQD